MNEANVQSGDSLDVLRTLEPNSIDSLVTDPPAGISFMGKDWDGDKGGRSQWIAWMRNMMAECLRVMKPGAHGLVWAIPRTSHWTATACEEAGFEIRDVVTHLFGSGFPKSLDISKAIDKAAGAERELVGYAEPLGREGRYAVQGRNVAEITIGKHEGIGALNAITSPATDLARQWSGWGTALKPASEHWILVRKPLSEKTVAANVAKWGVGGINVDGCRIGFASEADKAQTRVPIGKIESGNNARKRSGERTETFEPSSAGRFPANLILSHSPYCEDDQCDIECAVARLDEQSWPNWSNGVGASRFFYVAKPSKRERNAGCEGLPTKQAKGGGGGIGDYLDDVNAASGKYGSEKAPAQNHHPTVKPVKLMRYLIRMVTPPGGLVLDPFTGSGTTGVAAVQEGMRFMGIEREAEYTDIAKRRIFHSIPKMKKQISRVQE